MEKKFGYNIKNYVYFITLDLILVGKVIQDLFSDLSKLPE